jgi:hypothetical protein
MILEIHGFRSNRLDGNILRISRGVCASADGSLVVETSADIDIDITTTGVNGLDTGSAVEGRDYFPYLIQNDTTAELAGVLSASIIYGGVVVPAGWSIFRKLRFGFCYNSSWGGIPAFHLDHGNCVLLTGEDSAPWRIGSPNMQNTSWATLDLATLMPDNARVAKVSALVSAVGSAGSAYLATPAFDTYGRFCGSKSPGETSISPVVFDIRVASDRTLKYKTTGGARLNLYLHGYAMTEFS